MVGIAVIKRLGVPDNLACDVVDGGTINFLTTLAAFLEHGISVEVFTTGNGDEYLTGPNGVVRVNRVPVTSIESQDGMLRDLVEGRNFAREVQKHPRFADVDYNFYHTHHWSSAIPPLLEDRKAGTRHIHTPHLLAIAKSIALEIEAHAEIVAAEAQILNHADAIIALSSDERATITQHYGVPSQRIRVIPNGVSQIFFEAGQRRRHMSNLSCVRLVTVARLAPQKGLETLISALDLLRKRSLLATATIIGGPYRDSAYASHLKALATSHSLESFVTFTGQLSQLDIAKYFSESDVYVQPSRYESQGIAIAEAMAAGLPVVASRLPAIEEFVRHCENGLLVSSGDSFALADAIAEISQNPLIASKMSENNRNRSKDMTWEKTKNMTLDYFRFDNPLIDFNDS